MTSEQEAFRPIYEEIKPFALGSIGSEEWDADKDFRLRRLEQIVLLLINQASAQLSSEEAKDFLREKTVALRTTCAFPAQVLLQEDHSMVPKLHELDIDLLVAFGHNENYYETRRDLSPHTDQTLTAADILLNALTPEMGLNVTDDYWTIRQKASQLIDRKYAHIDHHGSFIEFATVIPGITVLYFFPELPKKARRSVSIEASLVAW